MDITVLYDNDIWKQGLTPDWGFSCLINIGHMRILFDTGADSAILLSNMSRLGVSHEEIDMIFISHGHWDHVGGLRTIMVMNNAPVYMPISCLGEDIPRLVGIKDSKEIYPGIISTGELGGIEQSLIVDTPKGLVVVVGCSHPGVRKILHVTSGYGKITALVGGLHGFDEFSLLQDLDIVCPLHCTLHKAYIRQIYPDKYVRGGVGKVLNF